jgi:glycine/D-amino acid oxidase-like deaminating enzyme
VTETADAVVIGGGVIGTSVALHLARRRAGRIVLLERDGIAAGATGRSSAIVRTHYPNAALARMALHSRRVFEQLPESEFRRTGFLVLVAPHDAATLAANVAMHRQIGIKSEVLSADDVSTVEPRVARDDIGAAAWEPESGYADPARTAGAYADEARRLGVQVRTNTTVSALSVDGNVETSAGMYSTRIVVVAAGYRTAALVAPLGLHIDLQPVRHSIAIVERTSDFGTRHPVVSDRVNGAYYRPEGETLTLIGTTGPYDGHVDPDVEIDLQPTNEDEARLVTRFCRRFPTQQRAGLRRGYTGVYDCSPDLQPLLGGVPGVRGVYVAVGFSGHGFKLSPAVGEMMAEYILDGRAELVDIELFSPARFAEGRLIRPDHAYAVPTL